MNSGTAKGAQCKEFAGKHLQSRSGARAGNIGGNHGLQGCSRDAAGCSEAGGGVGVLLGKSNGADGAL